MYKCPLKRIDLMAASITATTERLKLIDVSFPVLVDAFVILQPVPKEESPLMTIVRPFKMTVNHFNAQLSRHFINKFPVFSGLDVVGDLFYLHCRSLDSVQVHLRPIL